MFYLSEGLSSMSEQYIELGFSDMLPWALGIASALVVLWLFFGSPGVGEAALAISLFAVGQLIALSEKFNSFKIEVLTKLNKLNEIENMLNKLSEGK